MATVALFARKSSVGPVGSQPHHDAKPATGHELGQETRKRADGTAAATVLTMAARRHRRGGGGGDGGGDGDDDGGGDDGGGSGLWRRCGQCGDEPAADAIEM